MVHVDENRVPGLRELEQLKSSIADAVSRISSLAHQTAPFQKQLDALKARLLDDKAINLGLSGRKDDDTSNLMNVSDKLSQILAQYARILIDNQLALYGISLFKNAILLLSREVPNVITNAHAWLFALCLAAKRVDDAVPYLVLDAGSFFLQAQSSFSLNSEYVLLYFYYGGLIRMALYQFEAAAALFEQVVCLPTCSASSIQIEALKKLIFLNLTLGRSSGLPSYCSPAIQRASPNKCQHYYHAAIIHSDIVAQKPFQGSPSKIARLDKQLSKMKASLEREKNLGLAKKVWISAFDASVAKLPTVFSQLSLNKVLKYMNMEEQSFDVVEYLERFFQRQHDIIGKIDAKTGTVRFAKRERTNAEMQDAVNEAADACSALGALAENCDRLLELHPVLLARSARQASSGSGMMAGGMQPGTSNFAQLQQAFGNQLDDEGMAHMAS